MKYINLNDSELEKEADEEFNNAFNYDTFHMSMSVIKVVIVLIVAVSILLGYSLHGLWASEPLVFTTVENIDSSIPVKNKVRFYTDAQLNGLYNGLFATTYSGQDGCDRFYNDLKTKFESNYTLPDGYDWENCFIVTDGDTYIRVYFVDSNTYYATAYDGTSYFISTSKDSKPIYYSFLYSNLESNGVYGEFPLTRPSGNTWLSQFNNYFITMGPKAEFYINTGSGLSDQNYNPNYGKTLGGETVETSKNNLYFPSFSADIIGSDLSSAQGCYMSINPTYNTYQNNNRGSFKLNYDITFNSTISNGVGVLSGSYNYTYHGERSFLGGIGQFNMAMNQLLNDGDFFSNTVRCNVTSLSNSTLIFTPEQNNIAWVGVNNLQRVSFYFDSFTCTLDCWLTDNSGNSSNHAIYVFDLLDGQATIDNSIINNPFPLIGNKVPSNQTGGIVSGGGSGANQLVNVTVNNSDLTPLDHFNMTNNSDVKDMFDNAYGALEEVKDNNFLVASKNAFSIFPFEFWQPFITVFGVIVSLIVIRAVINILT